MADIITPSYLATQFQLLIDDDYDVDHLYQLMTQAKDKVESDLNLLILQDCDSTQVANPGDSYLTTKTLNANVRKMLKLTVGLVPYIPVQFINRENFRNSARRYYIDWKNKQFALCGSVGAAATINQYFLSKTSAITVDDEEDPDIIVWPDEFKPLIPYVMASIVKGGIDPDNISVVQAVADDKQAEIILNSMIAWDADLKLQAMGNVGGFASDQEGDFPFDDDSTPNLGLM